MLPVDQVGPAVGRLAAREQQRIAARAHERIGRQHRAQAERAVAERPLRHRHDHAVDERLLAAARPALPVVDQVELRVRHRAPLAVPAVNSFVRRGVGHPACARPFARHPVGAEESFHPVRVMSGMLLISVLRVSGRRRLRGGMALVPFLLDWLFLLLRFLACHLLGVLGGAVLRMVCVSLRAFAWKALRTMRAP